MPAMQPNSATITSAQRQKMTGPYGTMLRKMTTRMKQLQEEVALESVTNIEFEESSRRSFDFLTGQVKTLKQAFNTLTDTFLQELEHLSGAISSEFWRLEEGILKDVGDSLVKSEQLEKTIEEKSEALERKAEQLRTHTEQLSKDLDAVLAVIPKIEDSMLRTNHHVQDRLEQVVLDVGRSSTAMQLLEDKVTRVESELREEMEQRLLKQQRSITRQLESMSRVLMTDQGDNRSAPQVSHHNSLGSGLGGGTFNGGGGSPWKGDRDRPSDRDDRASDRPIDRRGSNSDRGERAGSPFGGRRDDDRANDRIPSPSWAGRDQDRDRDRPWSDRGSTDKSSLRLPVDPRRPADANSMSQSGPVARSVPTALDSFRDGISSRGGQNSPRQSSEIFRGNSPESQSQSLRTGGMSERLWQDPRQSRRDSQDRS